jgi:rhodanese-related sulfurtransferase
MDPYQECTIDDLLAQARDQLTRVQPGDLTRLQAEGAVVVDIRPIEQRQRDGELPGALIIDRNVLEWRIAPSSPNRVVDVDQMQTVIIVCNEGYQSSLAAATLRQLGVAGATDLIGGYQALLASRGGGTTEC